MATCADHTVTFGEVERKSCGGIEADRMQSATVLDTPSAAAFIGNSAELLKTSNRLCIPEGANRGNLCRAC